MMKYVLSLSLVFAFVSPVSARKIVVDQGGSINRDENTMSSAEMLSPEETPLGLVQKSINVSALSAAFEQNLVCLAWKIKIVGMGSCGFFKAAEQVANLVKRRCSKIQAEAKAVPGTPHAPGRMPNDWFLWLGEAYWKGASDSSKHDSAWRSMPSTIANDHEAALQKYGPKESIPGTDGNGANAAAHRTSPFVTIDKGDGQGERFIGGFNDFWPLMVQADLISERALNNALGR
jgi:hypothetical protein